MAIFEKTIRNQNFDTLLRKLEHAIPDSSWSAELEAGSDFKDGSARCSVRVFERYSVVGGNRMELRLSGTEYGQLAEGDTGRLSFQGTRYLGFERN